MDSTQAERPEAQVVFRPGKRRKIYRQRSESSEHTAPSRYAEKPHASSDRVPDGAHDNGNEGDGEPSVAEALRLRNVRKTKLRGVEFRPEQAPRDAAEAGNGDAQNALVAASGSSEAVQPAETLVGGINRRFAPQTGLVGELVNKHMEEYIESELARRHSATTPVRAPPTGQQGDIAARAESGFHIRDQPAMRGRLQEIDLGEEVRSQNIAMTDRARRRLQGEDVADDVAPGPGKLRIGRDGKPWHPRKRRGSNDIKRDQLVEEFLRENRLDVYGVSSEQPQPAAPSSDEAADERIAEEFRREFMNAMSQRRQRRKPAQPTGRGTKKVDEPILRGPKLGGSRNVRAAMRDILLKKELEKKR